MYLAKSSGVVEEILLIMDHVFYAFFVIQDHLSVIERLFFGYFIVFYEYFRVQIIIGIPLQEA